MMMLDNISITEIGALNNLSKDFSRVSIGKITGLIAVAVKKEVISQKDNPTKRVKNEISQFKIFGSYETPDDKAIFFERGKQVLVIRKGDKIDGKFLVEKISQQDVSLKSEEIDDRMHIDLGDF